MSLFSKLLLFILVFSAPKLYASHIVGGEITYECLGFNATTQIGTYRIRMWVYRDCFNGQTGFDFDAPLGVFDATTNAFVTDFNIGNPVITNIPIVSPDPCLQAPTNLCVEQGYYEATINLPFRQNGYILTYQRCCRNSTISNVPNRTGSVYSISLSALAQQSCNNSPVFNASPPITICQGFPLSVSQAATDAEGDQLVYSLCDAQDALGSNSPTATLGDPSSYDNPPFPSVPYIAPYTASNPLGTLANVQVNSSTGLLTANPTTIGQYVVAICVSEYRNGVLLSQTRRDFQFNVSLCQPEIVCRIQGTSINNGETYVVESCDNNTITFINTSYDQALIRSYRWDFFLPAPTGTVTTSVMNPTQTFPGPGQYNARLVCNDDPTIPAYCKDSIDIIVNIHPPRDAQFDIVIDSCDFNAPVQFRDRSVAFGNGSPIRRWSWNMAGTTSLLQNPTRSFTNAGSNLNVSLQITDNNNCTDNIVQTMDYYPASNVIFSVNDPDGCAPHTATFTQGFVPFANNYTVQWWFGDNQTFIGANPPPHIYQNPGNYTVRVRITSPWGCVSEDSVVNMVRVWGNPVAQVSFNDRPCSRGPVQFTDLSIPGGNSPVLNQWRWDFGNGATSAVQNPSNQYDPNIAGDFTVRMTVTDANGCTSTVRDTLFWYPTAQVNVTADDIEGCLPHTVTFSNNSLPIGYNYSWDFGDSNTATFGGGSHTYQTAGIFPVGLTITSPNGCTSTYSTTVTVHNNPVASFTSTQDSCVIDSVYFRSTSTPNAQGDALTNWFWRFGDGGTSALPVTGHLFNNSGNFPTTLIVTDVNGCQDSISRNTAWFPEPIIAVSIPRRVVCQNETVAFINNSYPIVGYRTFWEFGDNTTSLLASPSHQYTTPGRFTVRLTITSPTGICEATFLDSVFVNENPRANFSFNFDSCAIDTIRFNSLAMRNAAGTPLTNWFWEFGDGNSSTQMNPNHLYAVPQPYDVELRVVDANGCQDSITRRLPWLPEPITPVNIGRRNNCDGDSIHFNVNNNPTNYDFLWNFGDGRTSTVRNPSIVYSTFGRYGVTLTVTSRPSGFCQRVFTDSVIINENPRASFNFFVDSCRIVPVVFTNTSQTNGAGDQLFSWVWDWRDGSDTTVFNPNVISHQPANSGTYNVILTVTDRNSCQDTAMRRVDWYPEPTVVVAIPQQIGCLGDTVSFINNSSPINGWTIAWNFGDGNTSNQVSPSHVYAGPGIYVVTLRQTPPPGAFCFPPVWRDTVIVYDKPTAFFNLAGNGCVVGPIALTDSSSIATIPVPVPIISYFWEFGDGNTSTSRNPVHQYSTPGTYTIRLTIQDSIGCIDTFSRTFNWFPAPPISITETPRTGCVPITSTFGINSGSFDISGYGVSWNFGDNSSAVTANQTPTHTYTIPGTFYVVLTLTAPITGCIQTASDSIISFHLPVPDFSYLFDSCALEEVSFNDLSSSLDGTVNRWEWQFLPTDSSFLQNPTFQYDTIGNYNLVLQVWDTNGCTDTIHRVIEWQPRPIYPISTTNQRGCIPFTASFDGNPYPLADYTTAWSFGTGQTSSLASPPPLLYPVAGNYSAQLVVSSTTGCIDTFTQIIEALPLPVADFVYQPSNPSNLQPVVNFMNRSTDDYSWYWTFGTGDDSRRENPIYTYQDTGFYNVRLIVTHANGCKDTTLQRLDVEPRFTYFMPNAFTPNADGLNDVFIGKGIVDKIATFRMTIWNRWGEMVYETNDPTAGWNGRKNNNGDILPSGVYMYQVNVVGGRGERFEDKGVATLIH